MVRMDCVATYGVQHQDFGSIVGYNFFPAKEGLALDFGRGWGGKTCPGTGLR